MCSKIASTKSKNLNKYIQSVESQRVRHNRVTLSLSKWKVSHALRPHGLYPPWDSPGKKYWSGLPFPSPGDLPDPGIEPISPALQADSLSVLQSGAFHWGAFPTREELKPSKGSGACGTENPTLTEGVCSKVRIYCRAPNKGIGDKPQIYSNLVFEWGFFSGTGLHLAMTGEPRGFSRGVAGFSNYDGEFRMPLV